MTRTVKDCAPVHTEYRDTYDEAPRVGFYTSQELGSNLVDTPEGYLVAKNVPLARTGTQIYLGREVPLQPGPDGTVVVERNEEDVFRPETIESFNGKPFTDDHPFTDVAPHNYRQHMIGTVMNPRRGQGDQSHLLLGDIIVYDANVIKKIKAGKREVSCGYDASYQKIEAGRGRQTDILGNHVSLVSEGRCGATCAILDGKAMTPMAKNKTNWLDGLRAAFKAKDEDAFEEAINEAKKEGVDESEEPERPETEEKEGNQHHVTVNIGGMSSDTATAMRRDSATDEEPEGMDASEMLKSALAEALAPLMSRIEGLETALSELGDNVDDVRDPDDMATTDAIARAEILKPGVKLPTFDAKPGSKASRDAIAGFQRQVLKEAFGTTDGKDAIAPLVATARPNFDTMTADAVAIVFRGASERMRDTNNAKRGANLPFTVKDGERKTFDNAAWNARNRDFWKKTA